MSLFYSCIEDGDNDGTNGCVSVDPLFVDQVFYHLGSKRGHYVGGYYRGGTWSRTDAHSPLIDAGDRDADFSREIMPNGLRVNMGAYGNTPVASYGSYPGGTMLIVR